jgi:hypothetical protein
MEAVMQIIALDVHISSITAAMLDLQAPEPKTVVRRFGTDPEGIRELSKRLQHDDVVLLEATTNAFWLYDQLAGLVKSCYILNTRKVTLQGNKSDALDARRLVQLLCTHVLLGTEGELPKVLLVILQQIFFACQEHNSCFMKHKLTKRSACLNIADKIKII